MRNMIKFGQTATNGLRLAIAATCVLGMSLLQAQQSGGFGGAATTRRSSTQTSEYPSSTDIGQARITYDQETRSIIVVADDETAMHITNMVRQHREGEAIKILAFRLGDEEYAVRLTDLQEVLMYHDVTRLPRTPAYLLGITSLRGKVIPVIDLRERLGIRGPEPQLPRGLVLKGDDEPVGARVDSVTGVIRTWTDEILPALNTLSEDESRFISGVVRVDGRFVSLLELDEILKIELEV